MSRHADTPVWEVLTDDSAIWSKDGKVLAMGHSYRGELWLLTPDP